MRTADLRHPCQGAPAGPSVSKGANMAPSNLRVNGARLRASLEEMAKIGATPGGGVQRLTLTDEDKRGRDQIVRWMKEIDLAVTVDEMGNIFGRRPGRD